MIKKSPAGHLIKRDGKNLLVEFNQKMLVLSTSQLNGGMRKDIDSLFNHELTSWIESVDHLPENSIEVFLAGIAEEINLDPRKTTGLMTTASMKNAFIDFYEDDDFSLSLIISGGAGVNALRSGDQPSYREKGANNFRALGGTINIILILEASLPPESLTRMAITITEAKTAALLDLGIKSSVSQKPATGTGTDGFILACHQEDEKILTDPGNHSFLGYTISSLVQEGVKSTLMKERNEYEERERKKKNEAKQKQASK